MKAIRRKWLLLACPVLIGFLLFYIIPFAFSVYYSVTESAFSNAFVGWKNYADALDNPYFRLAVKNTLEIIVTFVPALVATALALAVLVRRLGEGHRLLRAFLLMPMLLPSAAVARVFSLLRLGNARWPVFLLFLWKNSGFLMVLLIAAMAVIPKELYAAAAVDGASRLRQFLRITLPLLAPTLFFCVMLAVVYALRIFKEAYLLYGAYPADEIYLVQHYLNNYFAKLNYQGLTAGSMLFSAILFVAIFFALRLEKRMGGDIG
ncbi:MAG: sugar ABC transporter permease [Clostridia bacterium]|nr:sugar ABC transporter permease [Clostridia bacterium]